MASKKDKFRKEVKKSLGQEDPSMEGIVGEIAGRRTEKSRKQEEETATGAGAGEPTESGPPATEAQKEKPKREQSAPGAQQASAESEPKISALGEAGREEDPSPSDAEKPSPDRNNGAVDDATSVGPVFLEEVETKSHKSDGGSEHSRDRGAEKDTENDSAAGSERIDSTKQSKKTGARSMARKRDSIYNVSSDIRLEDYTEADRQKSNNSMFKMAGVVAVLLILGFAIWQAVTWLMAPSYQLAIANQEITGANIEQLAATPVAKLSATSPVHIRFQWQPGELKTDYLKIMVERDEGCALVEEAVLGRRPPRTASYIYFMGPLDSGRYRVQVLDASGSVLADRDLELQ